ncbi:MAG TPA: hypothetical protein VEG84_02810 [Thermoanaerobaculia bacterium]|nr:hypothetical protein [Thermoanaerobaculia bacterium]
MPDEKKPSMFSPEVAEEFRQLGQSFSNLGRTLFHEGGSLTAELLRSLRGVVDRAREEIERLTADKK